MMLKRDQTSNSKKETTFNCFYNINNMIRRYIATICHFKTSCLCEPRDRFPPYIIAMMCNISLKQKI